VAEAVRDFPHQARGLRLQTLDVKARFNAEPNRAQFSGLGEGWQSITLDHVELVTFGRLSTAGRHTNWR
jgi:hypothetical protein